MAKKNTYNDDSIVVMEGLDAVRKRPGMYIGSTGAKGLHHLIWEVVDNSIDEALAGYCTEISVTIEEDGSITVADNGRGIPIGMHKTGKPTLEVVMTTLHAGGKFDNDSYQFSGGLHGVGISVVNALSKRTIVEVSREGHTFRQEYSRGLTTTPLKTIGKTNKTGTSVNFLPDDDIFETVKFNKHTIRNRLNELAYLNAGLVIHFIDNINITKEKIVHKGGIVDYIKNLASDSKLLTSIGYFSTVTKTPQGAAAAVEVALAYVSKVTDDEISFVNNIRTIDGGTHVTGFRAGVTTVINQVARSRNYIKDKDPNFLGGDIRDGLLAVINVKLANPQFESQTKDKLGSVVATKLVQDLIEAEFKNWLTENQSDCKAILDKVTLTNNARIAAKHARDLVMNKSAGESSLPAKLSSCTSRKAEECEIFIVEGNSAGGSAKNARDRRTQAILPLRGKILNLEKATTERISKNAEVKDIIDSLGCGISPNVDINKLRYHKIIIMADADSEGLFIGLLVLTVLYNLMPEVVKKGYVYLANPPLYRIAYGKDVDYCYTDEEKNKILDKLNRLHKSYKLSRYKGLGEMDYDTLWETTMDPNNRILTRVTIKNAKKADDMVKLIMGKSSSDRREFIEKNAKRFVLEDYM